MVLVEATFEKGAIPSPGYVTLGKAGVRGPSILMIAADFARLRWNP